MSRIYLSSAPFSRVLPFILAAPLSLSASQLMAQTSNKTLYQLTGQTLVVNDKEQATTRQAVSLGRYIDGRYQGSNLTLNNTRLTGVTGGASLTAFSQLNLANHSQLIATGANSIGVRSYGGRVAVADQSVIQGGLNGALLAHETVGFEPNNEVPELHLMSGAKVIGERGAAVVVDARTQAKITVSDGAQLIGGNGNMLEIKQGSSADVQVARSALSGNIQVDSGSGVTLAMSDSKLTGDILVAADGKADVQLQHGSQLVGRLGNVSSLSADAGSQWTLTGNSQVGDLALSGATVSFASAEQFYRLDVNELSGNGTFQMAADFATGEGDRLNVSGQANGEFGLAIKASGLELDPVERVTVVTTGGGDAEFSLVNGPVDLGAFSYDLIKEGNDWHLDTEKKVISPGTRSVLALFNTAPTVWYGELSSLRTRMGELRYNEGKSGAWGRAYGSKYNVAESSGTAYKQTQQGFTLGADTQLGDSQWLVGVLAGHSKSDLDLSRGTSGTVDSYYAGAYTTWLDQDSGYYFDAVAKVNRFDNKSKVAMSDGSQAKGNYKTNGVGALAEFGRHIKLDDGYFVEPFAQVSAVSIQGASYDLDSGLKAEGDRTTSVLGKAGATVGRNFDLGEGRFAQPYLRAAAVHEFAKNNQVKVNDNVFNNDLSGSRAEVGAGIAVSLSERLQLHADIDYSNGDKIEKPFGANVGVRFTW
ncbi:autotransporter outer membrane beta-barrel domain-containing protein [Pseudomonas sp. SBB6]|uniref:autotransporter outer membrane beta-barrel domain-containing protein n=1 Tax=Pseudomonas sp. SBB6 TaxID=2962032 RepID=UPI0020B78709|nr:autotransporter outer membrane beta-barrel domain-containing protein [Pseudomonas sp. SBB6]MCP3751243.1 autotransporter outer membrane beta-barrel domain-containing protein [Pseudomonas sp. SBB6]